MLQVLEPLEVRASDTATVGEQIGGAHDAALDKDLLSSESSGAVGSLEDSLDLDLASVFLVERFLNSGGDQEVSGLFQEKGGVFKLSINGTGESVKGALLGHPVLHSLHVEALSVVNCGVVLNDSGNFATVFLNKLASPVSDGTEALDNKSMISDAERASNFLDEALVGEKLTDAVVDAESGGFLATVDATLLDELASAAALSIDILLTLDIHVGVLDPGHDLLVGSHVGAEAVDSGSNKALLDKLHGVLAGHTLKLALGEFAGVDCDTTLSSTEGNVGNSKFESHEARESFNFLEVDVLRVAGSTLARELVGRVLCAVAGDSVEVAVVATEWDVEPDDGVASLDHLQVLGVNASFGGSRVVEKLDLFEEARLIVFVVVGSGGGRHCNRGHGAD